MTKEWQEATNEYAKVRILAIRILAPIFFFYRIVLIIIMLIAIFRHQKAEKLEPITGISSEGYEGKGHVQSPPAKN